MQFAPAKVSITQLVLSFLRSVYDAVTANPCKVAFIFAIFLLIVEVDAQIKSFLSHLKDTDLKNLITFTKMEKYVSQPT